MNSIKEREVIEQLRKAYKTVSDLRLTEEFLRRFSVIATAKHERSKEKNYCIIRIEKDIYDSYHISPKILTALISEYLNFVVDVYVKEEKIIYEERTGEIVPIGPMGGGEEEEYILRTRYEKVVKIIFSNKSYEHVNLLPAFTEITNFTEGIYKEIYEHINKDIEYILESIIFPKADDKFKTFSIEEPNILLADSNITEKTIKIKIQIFSDVNDKIMNKLKEGKYEFTKYDRQYILPLEVITINGIYSDPRYRNCHFSVEKKTTFTISEIKKIEKNFLSLTVKSTCSKTYNDKDSERESDRIIKYLLQKHGGSLLDADILLDMFK